MDGIREYLISVTAVAMLCGTVTALVGEKSGTAALVRLVCGLILCFTVISPLTDIRLTDLSDLALDILQEGNTAVQEEQEETNKALRDIICRETEAYIMDKAALYGASIIPKVTLSEDDPPVPVQCTLHGDVSPYVRQQLTHIIHRELDIPEERIIWMNGQVN